MSKRNFATLRLTTEQSTHRPRKVPTRTRPTCYQTEISSLSAPNVSVARVLFQPYFTGTQASGIHDTSFRSATWTSARCRTLMSCCQVARPCSKGFFKSMTKEPTALSPPTMKIMVVAPTERKHSVSIGGSILSSLGTFLQVWISKGEYDGSGRPSPIGSAFELTILTCCISELQCCMEVHSVSRFTD